MGKTAMLWICLAFAVFVALASSAQIPKINSYVTDNAGILSLDAKSALEGKLRNLEKDTNGVQFVVFIDSSYPDEYSIEQYALGIAEENGIGKSGNDNGLLLYIAMQDRQFRWEVGYGVESTLNAALLGRVSRSYLVPNFQAGDYEKGVVESVDVVSRLLLNSNDADIIKLREAEESSKAAIIIAILFLFFIILIIIALFSAKKSGTSKSQHRNDGFYRGAASGIFLGGFGRGGFGGGGLGGFSGGGGHFGGGGFSGRW